jgi:hypothetical protein
MVYVNGPIEEVFNIQTEETDDVAGGANVEPGYFVSDVNDPAEIEGISSDSTTVSGATSSNASIGSSDTETTFYAPIKQDPDEQSNYLLNITPEELKNDFIGAIADRFNTVAPVVWVVSPDDVNLISGDSEDTAFIEELKASAPHLFGDNAINPSPADTDGANDVGDIADYVDPFDPAVQDLLDSLKEQGIITDDMTSDEIAAALFNYVIENFDYISDGTSDTWSTAGDTIANGGGDCEDLAFLLSSTLMAALIDSGMSYEEANERVQGMAVNPDSGDGHIFVAYTADDGTVRILDPSQAQDPLSDIDDADIADLGGILFVFNDVNVDILDEGLSVPEFTSSGLFGDIGDAIGDAFSAVGNAIGDAFTWVGDLIGGVFDGLVSVSVTHISNPIPAPPPPDLSYIYNISLNVPQGGDIWDLVVSLDDEFDEILANYRSTDFWYTDGNGYRQPRQGRINALMEKIQRLTNLYLAIQMILSTKIKMRGIVQEEMEGTKGYKGMDTAKAISKMAQNTSMVVYELTVKMLTAIQDYNTALYQQRMEEAEEHNDGKWEQLWDQISGHSNAKQVIEDQIEATEEFMRATQAQIKTLQQIQLFMSGAADMRDRMDGDLAINDFIDRQIQSLANHAGAAIGYGDNGYLTINNDYLMNLRDDIVGLMNAMRAYLSIYTEKQDFRSRVHEEMTGVSGRVSDKESIMQAYENKFAGVFLTFDQLVSAMNMYVQLNNQAVYLQIQLDKLGGGFWRSVGRFIVDLVTLNWSELGSDIREIGYRFVGAFRSFCDALVGLAYILAAAITITLTVVGAILGAAAGPVGMAAGAALGALIGSIISAILINVAKLLQLGATTWAENFYDDEMPVPPTQYSPNDSRTNSGDTSFDLMNNLSYQEGQALSQIGSNLLMSVDDGMYQIDHVAAAMIMDMIAGLQNVRRIILALEKSGQTNRQLVHLEMAGVNSRESSQMVWTSNAAEMQGALTRFSAMMSNVMSQQTAHNLERQQQLALSRMISSTLNSFLTLIPIVGPFLQSWADLIAAENDPAYGMSLGSSPTQAYFEQRAQQAQGQTPEQMIEDQMEALYYDLITNGLAYAGSSSMGIDPQTEIRIRQQFAGLSNVMHILSQLRAADSENRDLVHKEMTGVKSRVSGELSDAAMTAEFQKMMKILDSLFSWLEEMIAVDDRADEADQRFDRAQAYFELEAMMLALRITAFFLGDVGLILSAAIDILQSIIRLLSTLGIEQDLLDNISDGGVGDLSNQPSMSSSSSSDPLFGSLDSAESDVFASINDSLISQLGGGQSYLNRGYQATANRDISRIYNVKQLIAQLVKGLQDMRNEIHMAMAGVGGRSTTAAKDAFSRQEQMAYKIVNALFRRLDRMVARENMIHAAEIQYWTKVIQAWINFTVSVISDVAKGFAKAASKKAKSLEANMKSLQKAKKEAAKEAGAKGAAEVTKITAEIKALQKQINALKNKARIMSLVSTVMSSLKLVFASLIELIREIQKYGGSNLVQPEQINRKDSSAKMPEGSEGEGESEGWVSEMGALEDASVNYQIQSADSMMRIADAESYTKMWMRLLEALKDQLALAAMNGWCAKQDYNYDKKASAYYNQYTNARLDGSKKAMMPWQEGGKHADKLKYFDQRKMTGKQKFKHKIDSMRNPDPFKNANIKGNIYKAWKWASNPLGTLMDQHDIDLERLIKATIGISNPGGEASHAPGSSATDPTTGAPVERTEFNVGAVSENLLTIQGGISKVINKVPGEIAKLKGELKETKGLKARYEKKRDIRRWEVVQKKLEKLEKEFSVLLHDIENLQQEAPIAPADPPARTAAPNVPLPGDRMPSPTTGNSTQPTEVNKPFEKMSDTKLVNHYLKLVEMTRALEMLTSDRVSSAKKKLILARYPSLRKMTPEQLMAERKLALAEIQQRGLMDRVIKKMEARKHRTDDIDDINLGLRGAFRDVFGALGGWVASLFKKNEKDKKKRREDAALRLIEGTSSQKQKRSPVVMAAAEHAQEGLILDEYERTVNVEIGC